MRKISTVCYKCDNKKEKLVLEKCKHCFEWCCSYCSINGFCIDCYVELRVKHEMRVYFQDKMLLYKEVPV